MGRNAKPRIMSTASLTITNALIFDGFSPDLVHGAIEIVDGVVQRVGTFASRGETVDAEGRVVVPGLIDAHFHAYAISLDGLTNDLSPLSYSALAGAKRLGSALRRGFTTVRDVAGGDAGLSNGIKAGLLDSPRYYYTGPALSQTGGHGDPRTPGMEQEFTKGRVGEIADGIDELLKAVRDRFRTGCHAIKIMASGGVMSLADPIRRAQYSAAEIRAVSDEARRRGSYVAAHAYSPESIMHCVENGVRSIEHGNLLDDDAARSMVKHDAFLVPTLAAADAMNRRGVEKGLNSLSQQKNAELLEAGQRSLLIARAAGVQIGFGTDLMGELEVEQLVGIRLHTEILGVFETLRSMTSTNAALLGDTRLGRLVSGAVGDAVIFDGNPFEDPGVMWDEDRKRIVVQGGRVVN